MKAWLLAAVALAACGDNLDAEVAFAPASGTRLKLQQYLYQDGTLQADTSTFYDTAQHATCTPRQWADGSLRCVPPGDAARFTDAACTVAVGATSELPRRPTHFLGYDTVDGELRPARVYRVTGTTDPFSEYYELRDGECEGPRFASGATDYWALAEIDTSALMAFTDGELGAGRIGLHIRGAEDGLHVPLGAYDRELDVPCTAAVRDDGVACEPVDAIEVTQFLDPECREPAVVSPVELGVPRTARIVDPRGCPQFHGVGGERDVALYRRQGEECIRVGFPLAQRTFELGAPLALAPLARDVEVADRRLRRIELTPDDDPGLRFVGDRLVDTATRAECARVTLGDVTWCLPANTAPVLTLYASGCSLPVDVVELPEPSCGDVAFAGRPGLDGEDIEMFAIGDRVSTPFYRYTGAGCTEYAPPPGHVVRTLGPQLPADTFPRAVRYGERTP